MEDVTMESIESLSMNGNDFNEKSEFCKGSLNGSLHSKSLPKLSYSRELLMKLKNHPKSKEKPARFELLDYVSKTGLWDPEHWHSRTARESKRPTSGSISSNKDEQQDKKQGKDDGDEFCFTPQRRSFVSGCYVAPSRRQEAEPVPPVVVSESTTREPLPGRRVGSGRITGRDSEPVPANPKEVRERREPLRIGGQRERNFERERDPLPPRNERVERNERAFPARSDTRDKGPEKDRRNYDRGYEREYGGRSNRYDRRKNEDDTPEWFHGGPVSQHDTIELRGFEEEKDRAKTIKATSKGKDFSKDQRQSQVTGNKNDEVVTKTASRPGSRQSDKNFKDDTNDFQPRKNTPDMQDQMDFNIEDFLKMDSDGLGLGPAEEVEVSRSSKASRWFGRTNEQPENHKSSAREKEDHSVNQDAARSLLEMLQKGVPQTTNLDQPKKIMTAEELERSSGEMSNKDRNNDDSMSVFNKFLAQVQENSVKPHAPVIENAPTEQDILANVFGHKMKIENHSQPKHHAQQSSHQPPPQDVLAKFLQQQQHNHNQQQQPPPPHLLQSGQHPFHMTGESQQHADVQSLMRDMANGLQHPQTLNQLHILALQQQQQHKMQQQHHHQQQQLQQQQLHQQQQLQQQQQHQQQQLTQSNSQQHQQQRQVGSPQSSTKQQQASSSSPLSFTPTAVMRKMTAEKDKSKSSSQEKPDTSDSATTSPPANSGPGTSNRLTGRTASQVQGATRASNQLGMNDTQQQQHLTGRPLVKGQELPFQQTQQIGNQPAFGLASNAAINNVAVKMLEQQQQHQLLQAAVAIQQQQQQRTSPLQQSLLAFAGGLQSNLALQNRSIPTAVPVGNRNVSTRTHFRPIHPQPMIPPLAGYSPFMTNQTGQNRLPSGMNSSNQFYGMPPASNLRGPTQGMNGMNALAAMQQQQQQQQQAFGNRSPNMLQGGNPLSRWFPPEIFSQAGSGQMPNLPPMPNHKILSLEELERLHTSPLSH